MSYSLEQLSRHVQGTVHGDSQFHVSKLRSLAQATAQDIAFINGEKYLEQARQSKAGALIVSKDLMSLLQDQCHLVVVDSPYLAFAQMTHIFSDQREYTGIADTASIHPTAQLGENVAIGDYAVIGENVEIGANSCIFPHVHIGKNVSIGHSAWIESHVSIFAEATIGDQVRIHANTVIGSEGFGFAPYQGQWHRIAQLGGVRIGHQVRIGSNCSVDRGALDDTVIDDGVILDNLVQVAHNVQIGKHTAIAANTVIAGSTSIGAHCIIGGASAIAGHLTIADQVQLTGMSMVTKSIHQAGNYSSGTGLLESTAWRKAVVGFRQLSEIPINKLLKQIKVLTSRIDRLESHQTVEHANERPNSNYDTKPNSKHDI